MTRFEQLVKLIAEDYRKDAMDLDCATCGEAFKVWGMTAKELKEDFEVILRGTEFYKDYTDDGEFFDDDRDYTFRQLSSAVRRYKF